MARHLPRKARPESFLLDPEGLGESDQKCNCARVKRVLGEGRLCIDPSQCAHLSRGVGCNHWSPFCRRLHALEKYPLGAVPGVRSTHSEVGDGRAGILTFKEFLKGTPVLLYTGKYKTTKPRRSNEYVMEMPAHVEDTLSHTRWLVGDPHTCLASRANHSCAPNMDVVKLRFPGGPPEPIVVFYASKRIQASERHPIALTLSYDFGDAIARGEECRCGSSNCCGLLGCNPTLCEQRRRVALAGEAESTKTASSRKRLRASS